MSALPSRPADHWSPLYFLASLGAGGLAVAFFMIPMFWFPHPGQPVPVFEDIAPVLTGGAGWQRLVLGLSLAGTAVFAALNIALLVWNLRAWAVFRRSPAGEALRRSNGETTLLAMPLALAMSVNVGFVIGLEFVPGLWSVVEYLFPLAMIAFALIGWQALVLIGDFLGRVLAQGGVFDVTAHNSFAQLLPAFALAMVGVGFAAPAAMSTQTVTVGISLIGSTFFGVAAMIYTVVAAVTAFSSMLHHGTARESGPTLMVVVPIMTVLGILFLRQGHGLHVTFDVHASPAEDMVFMARLLAVQVVFVLLGMVVLRRQGYFRDFVLGPQTSAGSYALVCPGVALSVMLQFFTNKGLVAAGVITKFGPAWWMLSALALGLLAVTIALVVRLNLQHFTARRGPALAPAE